ncbi:extracellular solute-binding protein [Pseudooceanicola sp. CBS1P-1]|uniref:Extracellular solute-binding protein n=1 Tax=Pseudooceanicola albus TaxID=2692189 RepID=A0A6L7GCG2_9RHOB|nr:MULTISPECIES: extracellular solute-binding protein [Pseudooceanicola]MBT9386469.1 extracellular solute-binding protein [Pseudooceanicola endophyticus]MXN20503.1 extracellular solute-binding protein [Pseudooceanicola albus]
MTMTTRRAFLAGTAAAGATLATPGLLRAQSGGKVVVGTWGGDYARLLTDEVQPALRKTADYRLVLDTGGATARKTKLLTAARVGGGAMDVTCLSDTDMYQMYAQDILTPVADLDIPNYANVFDTFASDYSIPHIYSGMVIVYDTTQVSKAPTSYADLWTEEYRGAVGFSDILFNPLLLAASLAHGGGATDFDTAKEALMELKAAGGGAKVYPSNEAIANAFEAKEIKATLMWKARAYQWSKAGLSVAAATPSEGAIPVTFNAAATRFAENPTGAAAVLNTMLDPAMQLVFAKAMGYLPTVSNAEIPDEMRQTLGFTDAEREAFVHPDYGYVAAQLSDTLTWWNQTFKA